jgi:curved DNA-binding protein
MEFKDYYVVMGVDKSATPDDIKRAHRKLARKYHPDVSKEKDAEARFKELAEAYDVLKDPEKRAAYDALGANYKAGQDFQPPPDWAARQGNTQGFEQGFEDGDGQDHSAFFEACQQ